jgi:5-methylcytosine-specific restriction enzyme subunit McrC
MQPSRFITVEEYEVVQVNTTEASALSPDQLTRLESLWRLRTGTKATSFFDYGPRSVRPKNWVGTFATSDVVMQVVPRGTKNLSSADRRCLDRSLSEMLHIAVAGKRHGLSTAPISGSRSSKIEAAVEAFCDLTALARRKRVLRSYAPRETVSPRPRGRIAFSRQAVMDVSHPGTFCSRWVELHENTLENQFLKAVLTFAAGQVTGTLRRRVEELLITLEAVAVVGHPDALFQRIRFERLPAEYIEALRLGRDLLDRRVGGLFVGSAIGQSEVLFMPSVFESFVIQSVTEIAHQLGFRVQPKPRGYFAGRWEGGPASGHDGFELLPDITIRESGPETTMAIVDAKWKVLDSGAANLGVSESDVYQMLAYGHRFNCKRALLIYPCTEVGSQQENEYRDPAVVTRGGQEMRVTIAAVPIMWGHVGRTLRAHSVFSAVEPRCALMAVDRLANIWHERRRGHCLCFGFLLAQKTAPMSSIARFARNRSCPAIAFLASDRRALSRLKSTRIVMSKYL